MDVQQDEQPSEAQAAAPGTNETNETSAEPAQDGPFPAQSPLDGSALSPVTATPPSEIPELARKARAAQEAWSKKTARERASVIAPVKQRLLARAEEIADLLHHECGKPIEEAALAEVLPNADLVDYWTDSIEELLEGTTIELDPLAYPGKLGRIHKAPRGLVGLITPWNYPVAIPLRTIVPALLAGNAVLFKPSEVTPRAGALVASLFEGLLPDGLLALVQGGGDVGAAIVDEADVVVFTGSVATGRRVAVRCAERLIPCSLELGGKDAAIVMADAPVERTANGIVWGAFTNAGQNCASIERVYVDRSIAEKLVPKIVELTKKLEPGRDTAVLTTSRQCDIVRRHLAEAVASGAEVLAGGAPEEGSLAFAPTVVKLDHEDTPLLREETFGPLLPIVIVDGVEDAITRVNASTFGLTTSLWTRRVGAAHELARRLKTGVVTINNHGFTAAVAAAPWTGTGESGYGITNSPHALAELTRPQFVLEDRSRAARELWWYPYTPVLRKIAFAMARARGGAGLFGRIAAVFELVAALPKRLLGG
ncbi:aldehyde dehydrogenase family protein [Polyangium spumosum]|uniref:Aldehyde dehydrogenase family protein n=1 Tax=Polyangium spumosum TaxID=889282 RepID=A0A6N7PLG9_9BACT|nr:aldehyde dehydrogenase family protein [Polyangium spumosum]MRG91676.1 aldehyde dehydrogenase family protein [Polyangium spumosum]